MKTQIKKAIDALENADFSDFFAELDQCQMSPQQKTQISLMKNNFIINGISNLEIQKYYVFMLGVGVNFEERKNLKNYLEATLKRFEYWQNFFIHLRGRDIQQINLQAREITTKAVREGSIEELRENIAQNERIMMILGNPGMGKSTSLQYLAQKDAQKVIAEFENSEAKTRIPLYLELRHASETIFDLICEEIGSYIEPIVVENMLRLGAFTIFLDGLNEIVKDKTYQVIENIQLFYRKYPLCVCLITSRRNDYLSRRFSEKIPVFDLLPMDEMQRNDFLSKNTKEEIADIIRKSAELIPNQNDFLSVPLFLLMLIRIVERNGNMPNNQALVVEAFLDGIYHLEEQKNPFFNPEQTNILMAHLAKYYFNEYGGNVKIPYSLVAECIRKKAELERFNTDALDFLKKLTEMQILENFRDKYTFKHQLFLDYFFGRDNEIEF